MDLTEIQRIVVLEIIAKVNIKDEPPKVNPQQKGLELSGPFL